MSNKLKNKSNLQIDEAILDLTNPDLEDPFENDFYDHWDSWITVRSYDKPFKSTEQTYRLIESDGTILYFIGDKLHRLDGPAIERPDGTKEWWYHDTNSEATSQIEFEKWLKYRNF
jgi:hypothetical protein